MSAPQKSDEMIRTNVVISDHICLFRFFRQLIRGGCGGRNTRRSARKAAGAGSPQYRFSQAQQLVPGRANEQVIS